MMHSRKWMILLMFGLAWLGGELTCQAGQNIIRNGSFELDLRWNGTFMRQKSEYYLSFAKRGDARYCTETAAEGWWSIGPDAKGIDVTDREAHSGKRSICVRGEQGKERVLFSAFDRIVDKGPYTLSAWVKTTNAKGRIELEFNNGWQPTFEGTPQVYRAAVELPANSDWTQLTVTGDSPGPLEALARLTVAEGTVFLDDVKIEAGEKAGPFNVRPEEGLVLSVGGVEKEVLPKWVEGDRTARTVSIVCDSRMPLKGKVTVYVGPWNQPAKQSIGEFDAGQIKPGETKVFTFSTETLPPDAYVIVVKVQDGETIVLDGEKEFDPKESSGGLVSRSMLASRLGIRFVVASKIPPEKIFGVGNGMLPWGGSWFTGYNIIDFIEGKEIGAVCSRGPDSDDVCYLTAVAGIPIHSTTVSVDQGVPAGSTFANPADPAYIDIYNPEGLEFFIQKAQAVGKQFAVNPMIVSCQMANEKHYMHNGGLCPSEAADAHFRQWCQARHGDLKTLNERWGTTYQTWDQIEQIVSAKFLDEEKNRPKLTGAAAIDWTAAARSLSGPVMQRMAKEPGRGMDWLRWRTETTLWMYSTFRENAKKFDPKTLYSTNLAWPNFWPQMFMPFIRAMDVTMVDFQYTSGWPKALGTPQEMMDIAEMSESVGKNKPFWGIEVYVQPSWPGEYAGLQNWAMVAHGMTNNLVFAWKPYSDVGAVAGPREWEKPNAPPMWFLIDTDGTKLPAYEHVRRTTREIAEFHHRYNGLSLKRAKTKIGLYVSPDTAEYVVFETGNQPWLSCWTRTRNSLVYALRMNGITADYLDDATLPQKPGRYQWLIVPASYLLNQEAAEKIANFARQGGTVILAGASGLFDPWLKRYANVGGPAWSDLNWQAPDFKADSASVKFAKAGEDATFRGVAIGTMSNAKPIRDEKGTVVGWKRMWGKGRLIAYGVFPDSYGGNHIPVNITRWIRKLILESNLPYTGRWIGNTSPSEGQLGTGSPVVEVVVRVKSANEKFVFCLNQGGPGKGVIEVPVDGGRWEGTDAITGELIQDSHVQKKIWRASMQVKPWEYRVIRLCKVDPLTK